MNQFFPNIAEKKLAFLFKCKFSPNALQKTNKQTNAYISWLQTRHNRSSSLN